MSAEEEADEPYELVIRFNSRPSDEAAHAIVDALLSVLSMHRVDAELLTKVTVEI